MIGTTVEWDTYDGPERGVIHRFECGMYIVQYGPWFDEFGVRPDQLHMLRFVS